MFSPIRLAGGIALAAVLLLAAPSRRARADGEREDGAHEDRVVAAYLEGVNLRIRAKADEARLLEATGQKDRALAALREIGEIQREAKSAVDRLLARQGVPAPSPTRTDVPGTVVRSEPEDPDAPGIRAVAAFLSGAQRADGLVDREKARAAGDPPLEAGHDLTTTALAVLAWLDAAEALGIEEDTPATPGALSPLESAERAVNALVALQRVDGKIGERADPAESLLATWALAAAHGRLARPRWEVPLARALEWSLRAQADDGWWGGLADDRDTRALDTVFALGLLQECSGLKVLGPPPTEFTVPVRAAMDRALVRATLVRAPLSDRAAALAVALMDRLAVEDGLVPAAGPPAGVYEGPLDPLENLFATLHDHEAGAAPRGGSEVATRARWGARELAGPTAGSWAVEGTRSANRGRAWTTAVNLLAFLYPRVPWREPKGT